MSDVNTGWIFDLDQHQMERFDPRFWGWEEVLPYGHIFPESVGWPLPVYRTIMQDAEVNGEQNRLVIEWESVDTMNRLYLNGKRQQPYTFNQLLQVVRDKKSLY